MSSHADEGATVDTSRAADEGLFADLYDRWSPLVYSLALGSLGDVVQAEAVTERVFARAWASWASSDRGPARFPDHLVDLARREVADVGGGQSGPGPTGSEESAERESKTGALAERLMVADGVAHLDTSSRRVLQLALDDGLTAGEIAGRTGLGVEEVRSRLAAGLNELRHRLEGDVDAH